MDFVQVPNGIVLPIEWLRPSTLNEIIQVELSTEEREAIAGLFENNHQPVPTHPHVIVRAEGKYVEPNRTPYFAARIYIREPAIAERYQEFPEYHRSLLQFIRQNRLADFAYFMGLHRKQYVFVFENPEYLTEFVYTIRYIDEQ